MAKFDLIIDIVLKSEGGFAWYKEDPGGATNRGITFALFKVYAESLGMLPTVESLKNLTEEQAKKIYKVQFWDKMKGDSFKSQNVANITFDGFVNMGVNAIKILQRELGVDADGQVGPKTIEVLNLANAQIVFNGIKDGRTKFYQDLVTRKPEMVIFLKGWLNRVNALVFDPKLEIKKPE